jgi:RpiR family transcriptional regulator, carbohydrate utilization regulator
MPKKALANKSTHAAKAKWGKGLMIISAIAAHIDQFRPSERLVAKFVLGRPNVVIQMSIADLAVGAQVSEPTIMRFCKALGCLGFMEFKLALVRDLERRKIRVNSVNPSHKGPAGFGQSLFASAIATIEGHGDTLALDKIDEILAWCAVARAVTFVHDGTEALMAKVLVDALLACRLDADEQTGLKLQGHEDGRVIIALRTASGLPDFDDFCRDIIEQKGKIVLFGFHDAPHSLALGTIDVAAPKAGFSEQLVYLALAEALRLGIEARLLRTGAFADAAKDLLQSQREIAYGDARRRDRQSAQPYGALESDVLSTIQLGETA